MGEADGRCPNIAGTFVWTTADFAEVAKDVKALGVDGIIVISPAGTVDITTSWDTAKYSEVWLDPIKEQDRAVDLPIFAHSVGGATVKFGIGLPLELASKICGEVSNIVGWKMTHPYGGHRLIPHGLRDFARPVGLLGAAAHYFHENLATGDFDGTVSGSWNYALEPMLAHVLAWRDNDVVRAQDQGCRAGSAARLHLRQMGTLARPLHDGRMAAWLGRQAFHAFADARTAVAGNFSNLSPTVSSQRLGNRRKRRAAGSLAVRARRRTAPQHQSGVGIHDRTSV